jgi:hypothetical protein
MEAKPRHMTTERHFRGTPYLGLALLLIVAAPLPEAAADSVELANGQRRDNVQITSARWDLVQYVVGKSAPTSLSGEQVASIQRDSTFLQAGRDAIESGDFAKAIVEMNAVGSTAKDWEQAEAKYLIGRAYARSGKVKEADAAFKAYLDKWKSEKDWWVPHAILDLADSLLAARQPGTAEVRYKELNEFGGLWALQSKLGQGFAVLAAKGESGALAARRLFDEVAKSAQAPVALKQKAIVGRSMAFLVQNQPQQVPKELMDEFFSSQKPGEIGYTPERAEATLLMGKAYAAQGGKENLEQAEIWFLRAVALYRKQGPTYTQACALLSDVYTKLGNKGRADEWKAKGASASAAANGGGGK